MQNHANPWFYLDRLVSSTHARRAPSASCLLFPLARARSGPHPRDDHIEPEVQGKNKKLNAKRLGGKRASDGREMRGSQLVAAEQIHMETNRWADK